MVSGMSVASAAVPLRRLADRADQGIAVGLYAWLCVRLLPRPFRRSISFH